MRALQKQGFYTKGSQDFQGITQRALKDFQIFTQRVLKTQRHGLKQTDLSPTPSSSLFEVISRTRRVLAGTKSPVIGNKANFSKMAKARHMLHTCTEQKQSCQSNSSKRAHYSSKATRLFEVVRQLQLVKCHIKYVVNCTSLTT